MSDRFETADTARREVLKKAVFVVPIVLTFPIVPSFASVGSGSGYTPSLQTPGYQGAGRLPLFFLLRGAGIC